MCVCVGVSVYVFGESLWGGVNVFVLGEAIYNPYFLAEELDNKIYTLKGMDLDAHTSRQNDWKGVLEKVKPENSDEYDLIGIIFGHR